MENYGSFPPLFIFFIVNLEPFLSFIQISHNLYYYDYQINSETEIKKNHKSSKIKENYK